jgi:hypothetical protein
MSYIESGSSALSQRNSACRRLTVTSSRKMSLARIAARGGDYPMQRESETRVGAKVDDEDGGGGSFGVLYCAFGDDLPKRLVVLGLSHAMLLSDRSGGTAHIALRELPFRIAGFDARCCIKPESGSSATSKSTEQQINSSSVSVAIARARAAT